MLRFVRVSAETATKSKENEWGKAKEEGRCWALEGEGGIKYIFYPSLFPHLNTSEIDLKGLL